jgi:hypothetical protein
MTTRDRDQLAAEVHDLGGRLTAVIAELHGLVINNCLATETLILDAAGICARDWAVPFGSLAVHNAGIGTLTVTNATPTDAPPVSGAGVVVIPAGCAQTINLSGRSLTLYGISGAPVILSVFTKPQPPAWANLGTLEATP